MFQQKKKANIIQTKCISDTYYDLEAYIVFKTS